MWRHRFYSPFWSSTQSSARQNTTQSFIVGWGDGQRGDCSAGPQRLGRFDEGLGRKGGQARCFRWNSAGSSALFRFPAPSSSQTERKREKKTSEPFCLLSLLRPGEQKHVLWSPLLDLSVNHFKGYVHIFSNFQVYLKTLLIRPYVNWKSCMSAGTSTETNNSLDISLGK